jgi:class 3 adenylate cyclase/CHASE2 domain-containing sensor protein
MQRGNWKQPLERLTNTRWFRLVVLGLVFALLYLVGDKFHIFQELQKAEYLLLDSRLTFRANELTPSEDIVILAKDRSTDKYARSHPEMNIAGAALPRKRVAQMIDYVIKDGARAVVLDVEFKDPSTEENDAPLEAAIQKGKNIYLAVDFPTFLHEYMEGNLPQFDQFALLTVNQYVHPVLRRRALGFSYFFNKPLGSYTSPEVLPLLLYQPTQGQQESSLSKLLNDTVLLYSEQYRQNPLFINQQLIPSSLMDFYPPFVSPAATADFLSVVGPSYQQTFRNFLSRECIDRNYDKLYTHRPQFLSVLKAQGLPVQFPAPLSSHMLDQLTYCVSEPIVDRFISHAKGIGVVSVRYFKEGFLRDVPLVLRAYQGNFYTYLGARPVLDLLRVQALDYTPDTVTYRLANGQTKTVTLLDQQKVLVNWRNPARLAARIQQRHQYQVIFSNGLEWLRQPEAACPLVKVPTIDHIASWGDVGDWLGRWVTGQCDADCLAVLGSFRQSTPYLWAFPRDLLELCDKDCLATLTGIHFFDPWRPTFIPQGNQVAMASVDRWFVQWLLTSSLEQARNAWVEARLNQLPPIAQKEMQTKLLGGGHLYRNVSAIDVLRKAEETPKTVRPESEPLNSLYNIYGEPMSGLFSFKNKVVIYGDTVKDIHRTPVGENVFGPEIVATVLDMLWHDDQFVKKVPDWQVAGLVVVLALVMIYSLTASSNSLWSGNLINVMILAAYWVFNFTIFNHGYYWLPLVTPTVVLFTVMLCANIYRYWIQDQEKRQLTNVFANYVSPQVMEEILKSPENAMENLRGRKKELTVLFTDIKNFTHTFENEDPEQMVDQLNEYFDTMINIILAHGGTIDKFMGDAIMAFFGAPSSMGNHAEVACQTSLEMKQALKELNAKWAQQGKKQLDHGIGLSSGMMFVGNFGSQKNKDFTVMGSLVNLGARLETYTREVDADIIISENTFNALGPQAIVRNLGKVPIKGFSDLVQVYALEGWRSNKGSESTTESEAPRVSADS